VAQGQLLRRRRHHSTALAAWPALTVPFAAAAAAAAAVPAAAAAAPAAAAAAVVLVVLEGSLLLRGCWIEGVVAAAGQLAVVAAGRHPADHLQSWLLVGLLVVWVLLPAPHLLLVV